MNTFDLIYEAVKKIPYGKVATYGQIAAIAGNPRWSRVVGYALHVNPDPDSIPCFRVVNRMGEPSSAFAFGGKNAFGGVQHGSFFHGLVSFREYVIPRGVEMSTDF